mgnify:FL=1
MQQYQGNPYYFLEGSLALARVQQVQGDTQAAWEILESAEWIVQKASEPQLTTHISAARALLSLRQGRLEDSLRWLRDISAPLPTKPHP